MAYVAPTDSAISSSDFYTAEVLLLTINGPGWAVLKSIRLASMAAVDTAITFRAELTPSGVSAQTIRSISAVKTAAAATILQGQLEVSENLATGDVLKLYGRSTAAGDTGITGSIRWTMVPVETAETIGAAVWEIATSAMGTAGTIGKKLKDWAIMTAQSTRNAMCLNRGPVSVDPGSVDELLGTISTQTEIPPLSPQQTADAMKLAPSAGAPDAGSVQEAVNALQPRLPVSGTLAKAGDKMDLIDAPNATAVTAIQAGMATPTNITAASGVALTEAYDASKTAATQTSVDDIPNNTEFAAAFAEIKGEGWTTETLKDIRDNLPIGIGADNVTIPFSNGGAPVGNLGVWVTLDAEGAVLRGGTLYTNDAGLVTFKLDHGSQYYLWTDGVGGTVPLRGTLFTAVRD